MQVGAATLKAASGMASQYKVTACPQRSGTYHGTVTFTTADGQYVW